MPLLAIDVGNSRIKWGLRAGSSWTATGVANHSERGALARAWMQLPRECRMIGSNVAGREIQAGIEDILAAQRLDVHWIESQPAQCGVRNLYDDPAQLGADRWAALIAARSIHAGACLVVNVGTAVTVDALSAGGDFLGGLIVPGLRLMREALARDTSRLGSNPGDHVPFPRNTADAIASGSIEAIAGAVERMRLRLREQGEDSVRIIASGGAIGALQPHLAIDRCVIDDLVLRGLVIIAGES